MWRIPILQREPEYCHTVFSELNLSSFLGWVSQPGWAQEEYQDVLEKLVFVWHRCPEGAVVTSPVAALGVRTAQCRDVGCTRCASRQGGFQFRYVSKLFTPAAAVSFYSSGDTGFGEGKAHAKAVCSTQHFPVGGLWTARLQAEGYLGADSLGQRYSRYVSALEAANISSANIMAESSFQRVEQRVLEQDGRQDQP